METITISIGTVLSYIVPPFVIFYITYYKMMTTKYEREHVDISDAFFGSLMITAVVSITYFFIMSYVQSHHFIITL